MTNRLHLWPPMTNHVAFIANAATMLQTSAAMVLQRAGSHIRRVISISVCNAYHFIPKNPLLYRLLLDGLCAAAGGASHSVSSIDQQICYLYNCCNRAIWLETWLPSCVWNWHIWHYLTILHRHKGRHIVGLAVVLMVSRPNRACRSTALIAWHRHTTGQALAAAHTRSKKHWDALHLKA